MLACDAIVASPKRSRRGPRTIDPVHPNAGIAAAYYKRLNALVREMHDDTLEWAKSEYTEHRPRLAQDRTPAEELSAGFRLLMKRWQKRFDDLSKQMAEFYATSIQDRSDRALMRMLKQAGFAIKFEMTPVMRDAYHAVVADNIGLIKSIPQQHLTQVQGMVLRSVAQGRDLGTLTKEIRGRYGVTRNRAAFIARDQNNKATAVFTRVRQEQIGATEALWVHSGGGRHPRPEHVKFSGKRYDIRKGAFLEDKWVWPGTEPNCRCVSRTIVPGFN